MSFILRIKENIRIPGTNLRRSADAPYNSRMMIPNRSAIIFSLNPILLRPRRSGFHIFDDQFPRVRLAFGMDDAEDLKMNNTEEKTPVFAKKQNRSPTKRVK